MGLTLGPNHLVSIELLLLLLLLLLLGLVGQASRVTSIDFFVILEIIEQVLDFATFGSTLSDRVLMLGVATVVSLVGRHLRCVSG